MKSTKKESNTNDLEFSVEYLGTLYFSPLDIAIIMELNIEDFLLEYGFGSYEALKLASEYNGHTDTFKLVQRGRLLGEAKLRHRVYEMALGGSAPAQKQMFEIMETAKIEQLLKN